MRMWRLMLTQPPASTAVGLVISPLDRWFIRNSLRIVNFNNGALLLQTLQRHKANCGTRPQEIRQVRGGSAPATHRNKANRSTWRIIALLDE